jgi:two-component system, NarL family, response regulator NreC
VNKIQVMLVEDHTVVRAGLRMLIDGQADMEVCADVASASAAAALIPARGPDVLLLDLTLPGGGSLPLVESLHGEEASPRILILTMHDAPAYVRAALAAGATGYVVKTIREQDLLNGIRAVHRGQVFVDLDDEIRTASVFGLLPQAGATGLAGVPVKLSGRESNVLRLLGQGYTNQAVAEELGLSPKTVATYRARIAEKLGLKTTVDFVKYATDTGPVKQVSALSDGIPAVSAQR